MKKLNLVLGSVLVVLGLIGMVSASMGTVTSQTPADNAWDSDRFVEFNCSGAANATNALTNATLFVDGVADGVNSTLHTDNSTLFNRTYSADNCSGHTWFCMFCDDEAGTAAVCANSTQRTFFIDTTAPTVSVTYPGKYRYARGELVEFTTSDNCYISNRTWTRDSGTTNSTEFIDTDNVNTILWLGGTYDVTVYVKDRAGGNASATASSIILSNRDDDDLIYNTPTTMPSQPSGTGQLDIVNQILGFTIGVSGFSIPAVFVVVIAIVLIALYSHAGKTKPRTKKRKGKRKKRR